MFERALSKPDLVRTLRALGVAVCLLLFLAPSAISGQAQDTDQSGIQVNVNLVMLDATVKDKAGQILGDLKKDDFQIREDGVQQKIAVFSRDELPLNVALVLDLSDSIGPFLGPLRDAATNTLAALKPDDQVALFTFATEAQMVLPLTKDKFSIAKEIGTFQAGGATNINDGIFVASKYLLDNAPKGRRVVILISDDVATFAGGQSTADIITESIAADTAVYNLKIPGDNPASTIFAASMIPGLVNIRKVTDATGGEIFDVQNMTSLEDTFAALLQRIKTRYTLGYYSMANGAQGKPHKLDVRLGSSFGTKGKNYNILTKSSFYYIP
jgi:Ca-activated chloride channel homolog